MENFDTNFNTDFGEIVEKIKIVEASREEYKGVYTITPSDKVQVLQTKDLAMNDNVIINVIPFVETNNTAGGVTVTIG
jgi:UDP-N-acetylglucosamine 2-epimerase